MKIIVILFVILLLSLPAYAYSPEISGRLEREQRVDTEYVNEEKEVADVYEQIRFWLRYRQQLDVGEYYFVRGQYSHSDYRERIRYSNTTLDLWTNYTFYISDYLRNRIRVDIRDKDYYKAREKSYRRLNLSYQLEYEYSSTSDYSLQLQRRWDYHRYDPNRNNIRDVVTADWDYEVNPRLNVTTGVRLQREKHTTESQSTDKFGHRFSVNFRYRP